jgi:hypothetical protein
MLCIVAGFDMNLTADSLSGVLTRTLYIAEDSPKNLSSRALDMYVAGNTD